MQRSICYSCGLRITPRAVFCSRCGSRQLMQDGAYRISELLGRTNSSVVYRAEHLPAQRQCVLKLVTATTPQETQLALNEIQILQQLARACPFIPQVHRFWSEPGGVIIDMEFIAGPTLAEARPHAPWDAREAEDVIVALLQALVVLHAQHVIHRDLKPENIKLHPQRGLVLLDFGIAKLHSQTIDAARSSFDPRYAPIEQISGRPSGPPTDLFAVGGIAYRLLSGLEPASALDRLQGAPLVPLAQYVPHLPPRLERLITGLLELDAAKRPATAQAAFDLFLKTDQLAATPTIASAKGQALDQLRKITHIPFKYESLSATFDGRFLLGYNRYGGDAAVYDLDDQQTIHSFRKLGDWICAAIAPDGSLMVSGDKSGTIYAWSLPDGASVGIVRGHKQGIEELRFIQHSHALFSHSTDAIVLWELNNIRQSAQTKHIVPTADRFMPWFTMAKPALAHDGSLFAVASEHIKLFRLPDGIKTQELHVQAKQVKKIIFSQDSALIASAADDASIRLWQQDAGYYLPSHTLDGHRGKIEALAFSEDSGVLASLDSKRIICLWDVRQGSLLRQIEAPEGSSALLFLNGRRALLVGGRRGCDIWEL